MEPVYLAGVALAALAAALLAVQNVAIRIGTDRGDVGDAVIVVMGTNLVLVAPLAAVRYYPTYGLTREAATAFAAAGIVGLLLGRVCTYAGIEAIGASRTTPVVSASALVSTVLAVWLLEESLTPTHAVGIVLIVAGVAIISWSTAADAGANASLRDVGLSLLLPLAAAVFVGIEPVLVRIGLESGTPIPVGLTVMMTAALVGYLAYRRLRGLAVPGLTRNPHARWYLAAGVASTVGLLAYFAALASAPVVIVIPIVHTAPLLVIALSVAFLPRRLERVSWPLVVAAAAVVVGASLVSLSG